MSRLLVLLAVILSAVPAAQVQAQTTFVSGDIGAAVVGPPFVSLSEGSLGVTSRAGVGLEWERVQLEFDAGVLAPADFDLSLGALLVTSVDGSFIFREPDKDVRPYLGGGLDFVFLLSEDLFFGLPWAHLTAGIDTKISDRSSVYVEGRTYGLESQVSLGTKFRF